MATKKRGGLFRCGDCGDIAPDRHIGFTFEGVILCKDCCQKALVARCKRSQAGLSQFLGLKHEYVRLSAEAEELEG